MSTLDRLLVSILGGELVTLATGLLRNTPPALLGAAHYGYPLAWLIRLVIAPEYNPWRIDLLNFFGDIVIWSVIVGIMLFLVARSRKSARQ